MRSALLVTVALGGCMQMQSARVLAPGKTRVSAGIARQSTADEDIPFYAGELRVAHGIRDGAEVGAQIARSAGLDLNVSSIGLTPKIRLYETRTIAISASGTALLGWEENGTDFGSPTYSLSSALYVGFQLADETELVLSPRGGAAWRPAPYDMEPAIGFGLAAGLSLGTGGRATVQPEVGVTFIGTNGAGSVDGILTLGVGITAGD